MELCEKFKKGKTTVKKFLGREYIFCNNPCQYNNKNRINFEGEIISLCQTDGEIHWKKYEFPVFKQ